MDRAFLAQATVVGLSGDVKTRPWTEKYPLADWGILQGLRDWDLCIFFKAAVRIDGFAIDFKEAGEKDGDQHLNLWPPADDTPGKE